jgi:hypothetical protein
MFSSLIFVNNPNRRAVYKKYRYDEGSGFPRSKCHRFLERSRGAQARA